MLDIIAKVIEAQKARKLNDTQFCELLGQTGANWSRLKNRKRQPTNDFLADVQRAMPELKCEIFTYAILKVIQVIDDE